MSFLVCRIGLKEGSGLGGLDEGGGERCLSEEVDDGVERGLRALMVRVRPEEED